MCRVFSRKVCDQKVWGWVLEGVESFLVVSLVRFGLSGRLVGKSRAVSELILKKPITISDHIVNRWKKRVPGVVSAALQGCRQGVEFQDESGRKSSDQRLWQQQSALPREPEDSRSTQAASCRFLVGRVGFENWRRQDR